jgi:hypothetical protein
MWTLDHGTWVPSLHQQILQGQARTLEQQAGYLKSIKSEVRAIGWMMLIPILIFGFIFLMSAGG